MDITPSGNNLWSNKVNTKENKGRKYDNLSPLKKDTVSFSGNGETLKSAADKTADTSNKFFDFDSSKIKEITSDSIITLQDGTQIPLTEYINQILSSPASFNTDEEYKQYILNTMSSNLEMMKTAFKEQDNNDGIVSKAYDKLKDLTGFGISSGDVENMIAEQEQIIEGLSSALNSESSISFEEAFEQYTGVPYSKEKLDDYLEISNKYSAIMTGCQNDKDFAKKVKKATGKSVKKLSKEFALAQTETFGKTASLKFDTEKYAQDKDTFKDKLSGIISAAGMGSIVLGSALCFFFPPAAPAGVALMAAGKSVSLGGMFIDNAMDLVDNVTDSDGLTKQEISNLALETGFEAVSYGTGRMIGKFTNGLNCIVSNKAANAGFGYVGSHISGQAAETGVDAALSLTADFVLAQGQSYITTGQFMDAKDYWSMERFLNEGRNQLMGILTGMASSKINAFQQNVITTAQSKILSGDTDGAKAHLKKSGMKMNDSQFEQFVLSVKEAENSKNQGLSEILTKPENITAEPVESEQTELNTEPLISEEHDETIETDIKASTPGETNQEKMQQSYDEIITEPKNSADSPVQPKESVQSKTNENINNKNEESQTEPPKTLTESENIIVDPVKPVEPEQTSLNTEPPSYSKMLRYEKNLLTQITSDSTLNDYAEQMIDYVNTPEQYKLAEKILSDEKLYDNHDFMQIAGEIIYASKTQEQAEITINLIDKILSNEKLYDNHDFMKKAGEIIYFSNSQEQAEAEINLIDKILSDEKLYNNSDFMEKAGEIIYASKTQEQAEVKINLIDKILSDEKLYNNPNFMKAAWDIIRSTKTQEQAQLVDKILSGEKLYNNSSFMKNAVKLIQYTNTKERVQLVDKILSNEKLYNNPDFMYKAGEIIISANTQEKLQIKINLIDKILSDEKLYDNPDFLQKAVDIIRYTDTQEQVQLADKILSEEKLYNNPNCMQKAGGIIISANTKERAQLADKILSDEKLYNNPNIMKNAGDFILYTDTQEEVEIKINLIDKILSNEKLYNNPNIMKNASKIIQYTNTKERVQLADKILFNEKLYDNSDFMKNIGWIIVYTNTQETAKIKINLIDKILSNEKLYNNPDFMKTAGEIIKNTDTQEQAEIKINLIDKILSNEKLYDNSDFMQTAGEIIISANTQEKAEIKINLIDKILSNEKLYKNPNIMKNAGKIIQYTNEKEQTQLADKILSNEKLYNNPDFMKKAGEIIKNTDTQEQAEIKINLIDKILSDEKLYNNPDIMKNTGEIIYYSDTQEKAEIKINLIDKILSNEKLYNNTDIMEKAGEIIKTANSQENLQKILNLLDNYENMEITPSQIPLLVNKQEDEITLTQLKRLNKVIGRKQANKLSPSDTIIAANFTEIAGKKNINEIPLYKKRDFLRKLVASNADLFNQSEELQKLFPLLPKNQEEYCSLLPAIVKSLGIETNSLSSEQVKIFDSSMSDLSSALKNISDSSFKNLSISQKYTKDAFIKDILSKVKNLVPSERQKVYDYFGFELHKNYRTNTGFYITGYPVNLNNGKKLAQITDPKTKEVVEDVRKNVIKFSENNPIISSDKNIERALNSIVKYMPELRTMVNKVQAGNAGLETKGLHSYDILKHSLKVMQKISQDENFNKLNDSDKKIMLIASLMHDITKKEGYTDKTHCNEGAFDMFFISQKLNLSRDEQIKLYNLIKHHEWLSFVNTAKSEPELKERLQSTAYDLRHDNLLDLSLMFSHADLKAIREDDSFHDTKDGDSRVDFNGEIRSFGESCDLYGQKLKEYILELQKSQPILPVTKFPSADRIKQSLTINPDGSTNVKGVYVDKDGLVVIKYNEVDDWEKIGFPEGSVSKGFSQTMFDGQNFNTGNIKFFAHGLDYPNQLTKFDAFSLVDSDALLSVSYAERPESKYRFFRPQGVLLDVDTKDIHGGGNTDSGSGYGKNIDIFKQEYIFGANRESDRLYISNLVKKALNFTDEEYINFVKENANKPFSEIQPEEAREALIKAFASINSNARKGNREYNEMYISNPKPPMAVFAYDINYNAKIDNPLSFLNREEIGKYDTSFGFNSDNISVKDRTSFLRQYALERNIPFFIFGD